MVAVEILWVHFLHSLYLQLMGLLQESCFLPSLSPNFCFYKRHIMESTTKKLTTLETRQRIRPPTSKYIIGVLINRANKAILSESFNRIYNG